MPRGNLRLRTGGTVSTCRAGVAPRSEDCIPVVSRITVSARPGASARPPSSASSLAAIRFRLLCLLFRFPSSSDEHAASWPPAGGVAPGHAGSSKASRSLRVMPPRSESRDAKSSGRAAECLGLFQQHRMAGERLAVGRPKRHGIAFNAGPFTEIVVRRQNLPTAVGEGGDRLGVKPAEGGAPGHPARCGPACCRLPPHGYPPPRPGLRQGIGFCPFGGLPINHPPCSRAPPPSVASATSVRPTRPGSRCPSPPPPGRCPPACRRCRGRAG